MANVIFKFGTRAQYEALTTKDQNTLYWLTDTQELMKGLTCYGKGLAATTSAAGLMSPEDKALLERLAQGGIFNLTPVDASIVMNDTENGKAVGVKLSKVESNILRLKDDGLYVAGSDYTIERMGDATEGYSTTYRLKKTVEGVTTYVGDEINIPKDIMLKSGSLETVIEADMPYAGAMIGDPYIDLVLNDPDNTHIYIPVKGIVDVSNKVDKLITNADGSRAMIFNEASGGGSMFIHPDGSQSYVGVSDGGMSGMMAQIYADKQLKDGQWVGSRINVFHDAIYYTSLEDKMAGKANNDANCEIATKGDIAVIAQALAWQEMK